MERIVCPRCGREIARVGLMEAMLASAGRKELRGLCRCSEKYIVRFSFLKGLIFLFPDRHTVLLC
ncbi:MAG: hypothetical protein JRH07_18945 [Deltaproteobacteria bacterium]|nr:hypothetical protein [Deltaproteobacteria bacterium]